MPQTTYLKDYKPTGFEIDSVSLNFDLHEDYALVESVMQMRRVEQNSQLELYGDNLELVSIELDEQAFSDYHFKEQNLIISATPEEFTLKIITKIKPQENTQLSGLYRSHTMFCTQCEAEGFRRITYFLDRPDVMTVYTTRICADKSKFPVLLSNGNLIEQGDLDNGRHFAVWNDPHKKPSYLFALVAGDLVHIKDSFTTMSGREVDLRIYVEHGEQDKCDHAMSSLKKSMRWDEEVYGREYDLDIFMIVAVSDFNMGAMENKGLNIFNSKYILGRPETATDNDYAGIEGVVGHEYFHNWTGNRVTCRDWFQLSLKEGLTVFRDQEFSRDMNSRDVNRIKDVRLLRQIQFSEDASPMAHPVRPESYIEINNFYTATIYNKGAEVIRMQHTLLGADGFRKGTDLYFERHDGQAVTIDDFVASMEDANNADFSQLTLWYSQAGTPIVKAQVEHQDTTMKINFAQSCPATPENANKQPFLIPLRMAIFDPEGKRLDSVSDLIQLSQAEQRFEFNNIPQGSVISLLRDFSAPIKLEIDYTDEQLQHLMKYETNGFARWEATGRYVFKVIQAIMAGDEIPQSIIETYQHILEDNDMDLALKAEVLTMPGFEELANNVDVVDVDVIDDAREKLYALLGKTLYQQFSDCYHSLLVENDTSMDSKHYGRRALKNICLQYMMKGDPANAIAVCHEQFMQAANMTDELAAFSAMIHHDLPQTSEAIDVFLSKWHQDELVMDKWFISQASSRLPGTLDKVKSLMENEHFSITNPNKVRSLIGVFCSYNHLNFHALDGSGYRFLTEILLKLDAINPQITARLATPFTRWRRYDEKRQKLIKQEMQSLMENKLSKDLYEIISKSL
jgi:aminopeptidase N